MEMERYFEETLGSQDDGQGEGNTEKFISFYIKFFSDEVFYCDCAKDPEACVENEVVKYRLEDCPNFIEDKAARYSQVRKALWETIKERDWQDIIGCEIADVYLDSYQELLESALNQVSRINDENVLLEMRRFLNKLMLVDCVKDYNENVVYVSGFNPLVLAAEKRIMLIRKAIEEFCIEDDPLKGIVTKLAAVILEKKFPRHIYNDAVIYTIDRRDCEFGSHGYQRARTGRSLSTLNRINSIRLVEKVLGAWEKRNKKGNMEIAYFGDFCDGQKDEELNIIKYIKLDCIKEQYSICPENINFVQFTNNSNTKGGLVYKNAKGETYDLKDIDSIARLVKQYDMVFLLDQGYYYRKANQKHSIDFASLASVYSRIIREQEQAGCCARQWDALAVWMNWAFSFWSGKSGKYEFDETLYDNIRLMPKENECEIYAYISGEDKIGEVDLSKNNVCREEMYYGNKIIVSHFPKKNNLNDIRILLDNDKTEFVLSINAWRLLKSLYDESYIDLYQYAVSAEEQDANKYVRMVYILKNTVIEWNYEEFVKTKPKEYNMNLIVKFHNLQDEYFNGENIAQFIRRLFEIAFNDKQDDISRYIRTAVFESIKTSVVYLEDFLLANYLKFLGDTYVRVTTEISNCDNHPEDKKVSTQTKSSVHSIIDMLDGLRIRELPDNGLPVKQDVIRKCCDSLSVEELDMLITKMRKLFRGGFLNSSLLVHNVEILCME